MRRVTGGDDWEDRVAHIRSWSRNGIRAPHKPLLLLYALGRLQRAGANTPVAFTEAEGPLAQLLTDYGPPAKSSPGYPFHHLTNDGLWVVRTEGGGASPGPDLGALRSSGAMGELAPEFADALLADPALLVAIGRDLLRPTSPTPCRRMSWPRSGSTSCRWWEESPHRQPRSAAGVPSSGTRCSWPTSCAARLRLRRQAGAETVGLEAAHVRWFNIGGPDTVENGLCVCAPHHKLLDKGAIGISGEHTVVVSARFVGVGQSAEQFVLSLAGPELAEPLAGLPAVADDHITWHTDQVFRAPPARLRNEPPIALTVPDASEWNMACRVMTIDRGPNC